MFERQLLDGLDLLQRSALPMGLQQTLHVQAHCHILWKGRLREGSYKRERGGRKGEMERGMQKKGKWGMKLSKQVHGTAFTISELVGT